MCDQATQTILEGIVQKFVDGRFIFTALNVSREAQKNHGVALRHNDMKNETHRVYADGDMTYDDGGARKSCERRLVDIPGVNGQAWAYGPEGVNFDNYDLSALVNGPIDTKDATASVATPATPTAGPTPDPFGLNVLPTSPATIPFAPAKPAAVATVKGEYDVDKRKRLWLPRKYVQAAGGTARGVWLDVTVDSNKLIVTAKGSAPKTPYTSYRVDSKGNIAISRNVFEAAGLNADSYDILTVNGQVVVKAA